MGMFIVHTILFDYPHAAVRTQVASAGSLPDWGFLFTHSFRLTEGERLLSIERFESDSTVAPQLLNWRMT